MDRTRLNYNTEYEIMSESKLQAKIVKALMQHPKVKWVMVITSGTVKLGKFYFKIGKYHYLGDTHDGVSDILGQMTDGSMLAIEVKLPGKKPTEDQTKFLNIVKMNNGVSGWVDNVKDALDLLDK